MPQMPSYPGVYVEEIPVGMHAIAGVATSICGFVGRTLRGPVASGDAAPVAVHSVAEFEATFGEVDDLLPLGVAVRDFFVNGGTHAVIVRLRCAVDEAACGGDDVETEAEPDAGPALEVGDYLGNATDGTGLQALRGVEVFNLLCIPPDTPAGDTAPEVYQAALALCVELRGLLLVDAPAAWRDVADVVGADVSGVIGLDLPDGSARNAALYFPRLLQASDDAGASPSARVPCGAVAGVMARTDARRGVWKSPAGPQADLHGVDGLAVRLTDGENGLLNPRAVNCLRMFPAGMLVWGARTMAGADALGDEYKYVAVRRLALHIEQSVTRGVAWAAFEPNGEPLWAQLRLSVGAFMQALFVESALQGQRPRDAYFVKCDAETTTQADRDRGLCTLEIGFAPLKPAEFIVLRLRLVTASGSGEEADAGAAWRSGAGNAPRVYS